MYFAWLDILRFLSALGVFFHHTFAFHYGKLGVYLFFIISGFVIYFSIQKGMKDYILGRFIRLFPLFWICCTLTYVVTLFYGNNLPIERYLLGLLMFNDGKIATLVDGSYWTLTFELLFYFYIGVFVFLFGKKYLPWFFTIWLFISGAVFYLSIDQYFAVKLLAVRFAPYFVFGGMLALLLDSYKTITVRTKIWYISVLAAAALMPIYISEKLRAQAGSISNFTGSFEPDELLVVLSFFIIIPLAVYLSYKGFSQKKSFTLYTVAMGAITYPLYLIHWEIGQTVIEDQGYTYGSINLFTVIVAIAIFCISCVLAHYDEHLRSFLRKKILRR